MILGEFVAQFKMTVVCTTKGPLRLTAAQQLPYVHSAYTLEPTSELGMLMQTQVNEAKKDHIKLDVNALVRRLQTSNTYRYLLFGNIRRQELLI
jgi:hypothetical protein